MLCQWLIEDFERIRAKLPADEAKQFQSYSEQRNLLGAMDDEDTFILAFAYGARFMAEIFSTDLAREET